MKRIISLVAVFLTSLVTMLIGQAREHPALVYAGVIIGSLLALSLLAWVIKWLCKLIGKNITSALFLTLASATLVILAVYGIINSLTSIISGTVLGILLITVFIRWLSKLAQKSMMFGEVFSFFTGYELKGFIEHKTLVSKESKVSEDNEYKNIVAVLKSSGLSSGEAKSAANYALSMTDEDDSLEEKIKLAFQYQGKND